MILPLKYLNRFCIFSRAGLLFSLCFLLVIACDNGSDGDPLGPSNIDSSSLIKVNPATVSVTKNQTVTFSASGGTEPFSWNVDNTTLAAIGTDTGVLKAGTSFGSVKVTAIDANGSTGTATVNIANKTLTIVPATAQVGKIDTQTFTVTGHTDPVFWSSSNSAMGTIDTNSGVFTGGVTEGTSTVTVLDADGDTATATVTTIANTIIVSPASAGPFTEGTQAFSATTNGVAGTYIWTVSGQTNSYANASVTESTTAAVSTTLTFTQPSSDEGEQTLTITATDGNGDTGTATITLTAASA